MNLSDFGGSQYRGPEINDDRAFMQNMQGAGFVLIFKLCGHHITIPATVIMNMPSTIETVKYINEIQCPVCKKEFEDMENKLHNDYQSFIKKGFRNW